MKQELFEVSSSHLSFGSRSTSLAPSFGPAHGGTTVRVAGSGFVDQPELSCRFGDEGAVAASSTDLASEDAAAPPETAAADGGGAADLSLIHI